MKFYLCTLFRVTGEIAAAIYALNIFVPMDSIAHFD